MPKLASSVNLKLFNHYQEWNFRIMPKSVSAFRQSACWWFFTLVLLDFWWQVRNWNQPFITNRVFTDLQTYKPWRLYRNGNNFSLSCRGDLNSFQLDRDIIIRAKNNNVRLLQCIFYVSCIWSPEGMRMQRSIKFYEYYVNIWA